MFELLYIIFVGHLHKWKIIDNERMWSESAFGNTTEYTLRTLQCETCGKVKSISDKEVIKNG